MATAMLIASGANAQSFMSDDLYYNILSSVNMTAEVTMSPNQDYSGDFVIPSTVAVKGNTYSVVAVGNDAFAYCSGVKSVTISAGVKRLGFEAFGYCENLESVTLNADLEEIGEIAFRNCYNLKSINIPASVKTFGPYVFNKSSGCIKHTWYSRLNIKGL